MTRNRGKGAKGVTAHCNAIRRRGGDIVFIRVETRKLKMRLLPTTSAQRAGRSSAGRVCQCGHAIVLRPRRVGVDETQVSYFRPQQVGKIGPLTVHSFPDSDPLLSQNEGRLTPSERLP
jgi:hypothetical protein